MALGKALGAGMPVGAALISARGGGNDHRPATTAPPTAATCSPAAPRSCFLDELARRRPAVARRRVSAPTSSGPARAAVAAPASITDVRGAGLMRGHRAATRRRAARARRARARPAREPDGRRPSSACCRRTSSRRQRHRRGLDRLDAGDSAISTRHGMVGIDDLASNHRAHRATPADARRCTRSFRRSRAEGHLLPRTLDELTPARASRSSSAKSLARSWAAPNWRRSAARWPKCVRSSSTADSRRVGVAARLSRNCGGAPGATGFEMLCAFTHDPRLLHAR